MAAHSMLTNILVPLLNLSTLQGKETPEFLSRLAVTRNGTFVNVSVTLTDSDLAALGEQAAQWQELSEKTAGRKQQPNTPLPPSKPQAAVPVSR